MKKIILVCIAILSMVACNKDKDNTNNGSSINPPDWVQGTWAFSDGTAFFKITSNDFCIINVNSDTCYGKLQGAKLTEEKSDTRYKITISYENLPTTQYFTFQKVSEGHIKWVETNLSGLEEGGDLYRK